MVPPTEGNEATRDGGRVFGASRSTDEGGELQPQGPAGGKGEPIRGTNARNDDRDPELDGHLPEIATDSENGKGRGQDSADKQQDQPFGPRADVFASRQHGPSSENNQRYRK